MARSKASDLSSGGAVPPVGIIAGGGSLPGHVVDELAAVGQSAFIIAIKGEALPELVARANAELGFGQIGQLFDLLKKSGCSRVMLIGGVSKRPDFTSVLGDFGTMRRLPRILKAMVGGDDSLLTRVIHLIEEEGFEVVGIADVAPALLVSEELLAGPRLSDDAERDLRLAQRAVVHLGALDIGQAAVAVGGRVVALEGAEGTDAMLERCAELRQNGRIRVKSPAGVLVKFAKPGQDLRVDLPTIGPRTVELAAHAGLCGIGVEAGRALIAERDETLALANKLGIFIQGLTAGTAD